MSPIRSQFSKLILATTAIVFLFAGTGVASAATSEDLDRDSREALQTLYHGNTGAEAISRRAKAILVFPKIVKAGFVFGGSYGEGELIEGGRVSDYYNSASASWGWQAGAESYAYVVFLMTDKAVTYLHESKGWEFGAGPSVVVVDAGMAENLSTTTLKDDAYAFITDQKGLMASLSIEGTKITRINR